jgi:hypothetical protein
MPLCVFAFPGQYHRLVLKPREHSRSIDCCLEDNAACDIIQTCDAFGFDLESVQHWNRWRIWPFPAPYGFRLPLALRSGYINCA